MFIVIVATIIIFSKIGWIWGLTFLLAILLDLITK